MKGSEFVQQANHIPRARRVLASILVGTALMAGIGVPAITSGAPFTVREKKAAIKRLQAKLDVFGHKVEVAAEKYNGAVWKLGNIRSDITKNEGVLRKAIADLHISQRILSERMDALYRHPDPSLVEVLVSSGSLTDAVGQVDAIQRAGTEDAHVVGNMRTFRDRTVRIGVQLAKDREAAKVEVTNAAAEKSHVEAIMAQRRNVLNNARADLRQAIADEAARQQAAASAAASSGYTPWHGPLPSGAGNAEAVRIAMQYQGVPYVWGGASPSGFDCSGLLSYAYAQIGKSVPHYTFAIWGAFPHVPLDQMEPGDAILLNGLEHVGMYIGNGMMIHAPHTGDVVKVVPLSSRGDIVGVVRP
ncbi:MAG: NlpC/P60 family protein [Thermoleophilia bacterium]